VRRTRGQSCGNRMNIGLIVVVSLPFPLLWLSVCTDRRSYDQAIKLREVITEILQSIAEWENGQLGVAKILAFKAYRSNLESKLRLIRGYVWSPVCIKQKVALEKDFSFPTGEWNWNG
jgi:hypothetical protein